MKGKKGMRTHSLQESDCMILVGDALEKLQELPDSCVDMCITSPPYWGLRDYGVEGQLGLEPTFQEYIDKLCNIFDEVNRVLREGGTCWVNLGDTYWGGGHGGNTVYEVNGKLVKDKKYGEGSNAVPTRKWNKSYQAKCLCAIPERFVLEMIERGWILRNTMIWHKPNCMPSSVRDRFTVDFEYLFFFAKKRKYYFEQQLEPWKDKRPADIHRAIHGCPEYGGKYRSEKRKGSFAMPESHCVGDPRTGRNKRCVWTIPTKPFKDAHFAVYPPELIETPIKAGCPQFVCKRCGKPREKIYAKRQYVGREKPASKKYVTSDVNSAGVRKRYTSCPYKAGFTPGIVLDPFLGSGTTAEVALRLGRKVIGIELNSEYVSIVRRRLALVKVNSGLEKQGI